MNKILFSIMGTVFFVHGVAVVYAFSPWGPAHNSSKIEVLANYAFLGFPASLLCFSAVYMWSRPAGTATALPYWQLATCLALWLVSWWLTMVVPWNLVTRLGAALMAVALAVFNFVRASGT